MVYQPVIMIFLRHNLYIRCENLVGFDCKMVIKNFIIRVFMKISIWSLDNSAYSMYLGVDFLVFEIRLKKLQ